MYRLVLLLATTTVTRQLGSEMNQVAGPNAMHNISHSSHTKASLKLCAARVSGGLGFAAFALTVVVQSGEVAWAIHATRGL